MKQYNLISTKDIVHTGIAGLDKEIVGLYIGERTILFGKDKEGISAFMERLKNDCMVSSRLPCRTIRTVYVCDCEQRHELPHPLVDIAENVLQIFERDGKHIVYVWKNRMNGKEGFECEIV